MKVKKILCGMIAAAMVASGLPMVIHADNTPTMEDNVIYSQDFTDFGYTTNNNDANYGGKYISVDGAAADGAFSGKRFVYQSARQISGGVIKVESTVKISEAITDAKLMSSYKKDGSTVYTDGFAYCINTNSSQNFVVKAFDSTGAGKTYTLLSGYELNKPYKLAAYVDLDSGRLQIQLDGKNMLSDKEMYISQSLFKKASSVYDTDNFVSANMDRLFDTQASEAGKFTVDNIKVTREAALPVSSYYSEASQFSENFTNFSTSNYIASNEVENNIVDFTKTTSKDDTENHGNVFKAVKGTRLLKSLSTVSGKYSVKADMYFTTGSENGVVFAVGDSSSKSAARFRVQNGKVMLQEGDGTKTVGSFTYAKDTWYRFELVFDTDAKTIKAYVDGSEFGSGTLGTLTDYKRPFECDNRNLEINGLYMDNIDISKVSSADYSTASDYETVIVNENFDRGSLGNAFTTTNGLTNPTAADGAMQFNSGNRMLKTYSGAEGTYVVDYDVMIKDFGSNKKALFGTAGNDGQNRLMYNIYTESGKLGISAYNAEGNLVSYGIIDNAKTDTWYNIRVSFNLTSKRIHVFVNDIEVLANTELYLGNYGTSEVTTPAITRIYDFNNKDTSRVFRIDNLKAYRDTMAESLNIENGTLSTSSFTLPSTIGGKTVYWTSYSDYLTIADNTATVKLGDNTTAKYPVIQAMVEDANGRATRRYTYYMPANTVDFSGIPANTTEDINSLPFVTSDGVIINWTSSHPDIITSTGAVTRPANTTTVTLTAQYAEITKTFDVVVEGMNDADEVFVTDDGLYIGETKLVGKSDISGKTVSFKANIHNGTEALIDVTPIIALYKDNRMESVQLGKTQNIEANTAGEAVSLSVNVPSEGNYSIKGFIWDMTTLYPYSRSAKSEDKSATLHVIGDSTTKTYNKTNDYEEGGIGEFIGEYFDNNITVVNYSEGGRSTKSFMVEGRFNTALASAKAGDYMYISLGINDTAVAKAERYTTPEQYKDFLKIYIQAAKDRDIIPFLVTPTLTGSCTGTQGKVDSVSGQITSATVDSVTYSTTVADRRALMAEVADQTGVVNIQLGEKMKTELEKLSLAEQWAFYFQEANESWNTMVHLDRSAARQVSIWLAGLIKDAGINGLSGYVNVTE